MTGLPLVTVVTAIASQSVTGFCAIATLVNASPKKIVENIRIAKYFAVCLLVPGFMELIERNRIVHLFEREDPRVQARMFREDAERVNRGSMMFVCLLAIGATA
ncbi:MAG TPA: hypothetical protein VNB49_18910 [Candidatus Dormibacteraeota bacterium]|nr:hypothetical protein [Candidatus Dormibacteraeota bacterium]